MAMEPKDKVRVTPPYSDDKADRAKAESYGAKAKDTKASAEKTDDELAQEKADREAAAEREARAKIKAAEDEGEVRNLAEKEADRLRMEGGEPIKSVAGKPSGADPREVRPPTQQPAGTANASATNPALAGNDAVPTAALANKDEEALAAAKAEGKTVVPLHSVAVS